MNILVAEDSVAYAVLYRQIFESRGHSVKITLDGEECLSTYMSETTKHQNSKPYDVVILDHSMPKMTGFDVAKEILRVRPNQRILFITGFGDELESKIEEFGLGKDISIFEKPFNSSNLIEKIEQVLKEETINKILLS